jgi:hypothetical protein
MRLWVEPAGREEKSADVERKTVKLIYPYPGANQLILEVRTVNNSLLGPVNAGNGVKREGVALKLT